MQQRAITMGELKKINSKLTKKRFGVLNQIESGTFEETQNHQKQYHIVLVDKNPYKQFMMLGNIGRLVKEVLGADKVYYLGTLIA